jgi:hypothetical protein
MNGESNTVGAAPGKWSRPQPTGTGTPRRWAGNNGDQSQRTGRPRLPSALDSINVSPRSPSSSQSTGKWARPSNLSPPTSGVSHVGRLSRSGDPGSSYNEQSVDRRRSTTRPGLPSHHTGTHGRDSPHEHGHRHRDVQRDITSHVPTPSFAELDAPMKQRPSRDEYKRRGSLLSRIHGDVTIEGHSKTHSLARAATPTRKKKDKRIKFVPVDIYIPSVCSVGNLAKLLNVKLGMNPSMVIAFFR